MERCGLGEKQIAGAAEGRGPRSQRKTRESGVDTHKENASPKPLSERMRGADL